MIDYDPKDWLRFIFSVHKSDTIRKLAPVLVGMAAYCLLVAYMVIEYWHPGPDSDLKNVYIMHSLLGFVISLLLVFRTNTAYDRWWEGRKAWGTLTTTPGIWPSNWPTYSNPTILNPAGFFGP